MGALSLSLSRSQLIFCRNGFFLVSISFDMCVALPLVEQIFHPTDIVVILLWFIFVNMCTHTHASLWLHVIKSQIEINSYVYVRFCERIFIFLFNLWIRPKKKIVCCIFIAAALQQQQFISIFFHLLCVTLTLLSDLTLLFGMCFINSWAWCFFLALLFSFRRLKWISSRIFFLFLW